jgi:hypothetical protein
MLNVNREELWRKASFSSEMEARDAIEELSLTADVAEVLQFADIFACRIHWLDRVEVVEALGRIANPAARAILADIVMHSRQRMVKYYAARNLIELDEPVWKVAIPKNAKSHFWKSLLAYHRFINDELSLDQLKELARRNCSHSGDHWYWLTILEKKMNL